MTRSALAGSLHFARGMTPPTGWRETKTWPGTAFPPIQSVTRCQPRGVRPEFAFEPVPAFAVETA